MPLRQSGSAGLKIARLAVIDLLNHSRRAVANGSIRCRSVDVIWLFLIDGAWKVLATTRCRGEQDRGVWAVSLEI